MSSYILRNIPDDLWPRVKARAEREAIPLRQVILLLLRAYADERVFLGARDRGDELISLADAKANRNGLRDRLRVELGFDRGLPQGK